MGSPIVVATRAFDFLLNQADYLHAEQDLRVLLDHFGSTFTALGGVESAVLNEWNRLVTRDDVLCVLPVAKLFFELKVAFPAQPLQPDAPGRSRASRGYGCGSL